MMSLTMTDQISVGIVVTEGVVMVTLKTCPKLLLGVVLRNAVQLICDEPYQLIINTNVRRKQGQQQ